MVTLQTLDLPFVLSLFFVLYIPLAAFLPYRSGYRPLLFRLFDGAGAEITRRLNRAAAGAKDRVFRGRVVVLMMAGLGLVIGAAVDRIAAHDYGWIAQLLFLPCVLSAYLPVKMLQTVAKQKPVKNTLAAILDPYVRDEDLEKRDIHGLVRRAVELAAVWNMQYMVAPLLYFVLCGARGAAVYVALAALYQVAGADKYFGRAARRIETIIHFVPMLLSALVLILAACCVSRARPVAGMWVLMTQHGFLTPKSHGILTATVAGVLDVTLGGPRARKESGGAGFKWIGAKEASAQLAPQEISRMALLSFVSFLWIIVIFMAAIVFSY